MLTIENLEYKYESGFHLEPINIKIKEKSITALLGPNGSGKTTLFSLILGTKKPHKGKIQIDGKDILGMKDKDRAKLIGTVSQTNKINFNYTVEELLNMSRYPYKTLFSGTSKTDKKEIEKAINLLELKKFKNRHIKSLSGGEYQKVLIAMAIVQQTKIILLDEPGNHLDLKHQTLLLNLLQNEATEGKIVIAVLHNLNQALHYANNCILLKQGKTISTGPPNETLNPKNIKKIFETELSYYYNQESKRILGPK